MFQNAFVAFRLFVMQYRCWFLLVFVFFGAVFQYLVHPQVSKILLRATKIKFVLLVGT